MVAIGNPFGLDRTATAGIVSAVQRQINAPNGFTISNAIQTDAPINPGNSGGPLIDAEGRVIGINSQIESGGQSEGNVGIGFAVPIDTAQEIAQQLIDHGEVQHAFLGISGADLTPEIADVLNLDVEQRRAGPVRGPRQPRRRGRDRGRRRADVTIDGQQVRAGGDVITAVDGEAVAGMDDVIAAVDAKQPGDELELTLLRGGDERTVTVTSQKGPRKHADSTRVLSQDPPSRRPRPRGAVLRPGSGRRISRPRSRGRGASCSRSPRAGSVNWRR